MAAGLAFLLAVAYAPMPTLGATGLVLLFGLMKAYRAASTAQADSPLMSANGLPALNADWIGEEVLVIDDERIPPAVRAHGARFRNPARYAIEVGPGEYVLYGADGELLDLCCLK